ncbi:MAG: D-lyxose/D-mannose family sugar isomerase [Mangrovicoccus sp.]|nr:D-lyxose/D-mannose family sugar isomerase [Mangrovicoccus sp.]
MKRSEINRIMEEADGFIRSFGHVLPPFAYWSPDQMRARQDQARGIIDGRLGWDITDYGGGDFAALGLFLFTTRNGRLQDLRQGGGMCYAEKIMISRRDQISPMHTHVIKVEDIINRGGARLAVQLYGSDPQGGFDETAGGQVWRDGRDYRFAPGEVLLLDPGESVTLRPGDWHKFWGEGGDVLIGEVSTVNDDLTDNIFHPPLGRFAQIQEDCDPRHLLVSDYPVWLNAG